MDYKTFKDHVFRVVKKSSLVRRTEILHDMEPFLKIRLHIEEDFVDVTFNAETGKTSYAYIRGDERIFGANML
ncbi:MAG: hypothetical protein QMC85_00785 [Methanocellales archaeon]|nr:hypothetical protein [Methanocellales archaeon]